MIWILQTGFVMATIAFLEYVLNAKKFGKKFFIVFLLTASEFCDIGEVFAEINYSYNASTKFNYTSF